MGLVDLLRGRRVYLDANVFVYALEGEPSLRDLVTPVFDAVDAGEVAACTGEITLSEVLVVPYRTADEALVAAYEELLGPRSPLDVLPVTAATWREAARLRARTSLRLPDAVHLAAAREGRADVFLTHDHRLLRVENEGISVRVLGT